MADPLFLDFVTVERLHAAQMALFSSPAAPLLDRGLLEAAVSAPQNLWVYDDEADIFDLAASYCAHVVWNHPYQDGNKRLGLSTALHFLAVNGLDPTVRENYPNELHIDDRFLAASVLALATRTIPEAHFAEMLFLMLGPRDVTQALQDLKNPLRAALQTRRPRFNSAEEIHAYIVDFIMSRMAGALIDRCQKFFIKPDRYHEMEEYLRQTYVPSIAPQFQIEFGMVTEDLDDDDEA